LFQIGNYDILLKFQIIKKPQADTAGISSRIPGTSLHVAFLDYDNIVDELLIEELRFLQEEFEMGNFHVIKTNTKARHVICLDVFTFAEVLQIVRFSGCDLMFKRAPRINEYRCWVLRFAKKGKRNAPDYLYAVESPYEGKNLQSQSHANYLAKFGIEIDLQKPFGPEELEIQVYKTAKRTEKDLDDKDDS